jgi:hypothetical protein
VLFRSDQESEFQKKSDEEEEIEIEPEELPASKQEPEKNIQQTEPGEKLSLKKPEEDGYIRISPTEARELLSYKGKMFTAIFTKRSDGSLRSLNGMTGVRKYTSGGELPYSPKEKELIPVYDLKKGPGKQGYRTIPIEGLKALKINGKKYKIDQTLNEMNDNKKKSRRFIPTSIKFEKSIRSKFSEHFKLMKSPNEDYKLYISPMMKVSLEAIQRGRTSMDTRSKQSELVKLIQEKIPNDVRSILKKYSPKINTSLNMYPINSKIEKIEDGDIYFYSPTNPETAQKAYDNIISENMKKTALKQLIKEVLLEVKASKKILKEENENRGITVLGRDLKIGQEFGSKPNHPIIKLEPNTPTQGRILVYIEGRPKPINMQMGSSYSVVDRSISENSPLPQRQSPDREVIEKPETDTPERKPRRRTLTPPTEAPNTRPKAIKENDKQIANKIADRFKKLK